MQSPYLKLHVVEVTHETSDTVTLHLEHPEKKSIAYKPGQFLTLILPINGKSERRSYSLCSTPHEAPRLSVTIKRVPGGLVSNYVPDHITVGQELEVLEPMGNFNITTNPAAQRHILLFGAGSGITPLMAILKAVLLEEPLSKVTLLYGNRHEEAVIFKDKLQQLQQTYPERLQVEYIYSQPKSECVHCAHLPKKKNGVSGFFAKLTGAAAQNKCEHHGRMNQSMVIKILERLELTKPENALYFVCGPQGMMEEVQKALRVLQVPAERVLRESFVSTKTGTAQQEETHGQVMAAGDDGKIRTQTVTLIYEGAEYKVEVPPDQTILEAGLAQDIDLPYSCQAGLCTACRGKCLSGKVHLDEREGLSDTELDEGYVLNCVGHPLTNDVIIEIK
ncbi:ferredoxin--NADP reductase [Botryobacter ruber]|uniref:ferredoxin--NADP reductase n=1 Tax=Botryobacter ruber TaxID=2171629 RepID=UPI000E0B23CD|nr:ferredoxin--NADP reductase [Botryobacter ruber]